MVYVDTSVFVALHTHEQATPIVVAWYASAADGGLATADWTVTEFASALAIKSRTGRIDRRQMNAAWRNFDLQCTEEVRLLTVDREAFRGAASVVRRPRTTLRAADALHLTVARRAGIEVVATLDRVMQAEARALRMRIVPLV